MNKTPLPLIVGEYVQFKLLNVGVWENLGID